MEDIKTGENGGNVGGNNDNANIEMQKEIDRAVSKALATQKAKLDKEHSEQIGILQGKLDAFENAGLTDAEKAAKQIAAAKAAEDNYNTMVKRFEVKSEFAAMGIDEADYAPVIDDLFKGDFKSATSKIGSIVKKEAAKQAQTLYNAQIANIPQPKTGKDDKVWTKESFGKLTYSEQMAEISKDPSLVKLV